MEGRLLLFIIQGEAVGVYKLHFLSLLFEYVFCLTLKKKYFIVLSFVLKINTFIKKMQYPLAFSFCLGFAGCHQVERIHVKGSTAVNVYPQAN